MKIPVADNEEIKLKRMVSFIVKHVEMLKEAVEHRDLHTAHFLAGVVRQNVVILEQFLFSILYEQG